MLRTIIIDDELAGINSLKLLLEKHHAHEVKIVASSSDPKKGVTLIDDYQPDFVFLDINMPGMSGFDVINTCSYRDFKVVFTTAHEKFAIAAIKSGAYDYLLKPIDIEELRKCIDGLLNTNNRREAIVKNPGEKILELVVKGTIYFIRHSDIIRVEASGSYSVFYLNNNIQYTISKTLKECEKLLDSNLFYRCHNSHIINLGKIIKLISNEGYVLELSDGSVVEIARKNKDILLDKLKNFEG